MDIGTTGVSAVLRRRATGELYPLHWERSPAPSHSDGTDGWYRLPLGVCVDQRCTSDELGRQRSLDDWDIGLYPTCREETAEGVVSSLKPYLNLGVPYYSLPTLRWEPVLQWSDVHQMPLAVLRYALHQAFMTLSAQASVVAAPTRLTCSAVGLDSEALRLALQDLSGVIVNCPLGWSDAYRINLREALRVSGLVADTAQVWFINDAIAALMAGLTGADGEVVVLPTTLSTDQLLHNLHWQGATLVISAGSAVTELLMIDLPPEVRSLPEADFSLRRLDYAGDALDQDIVCQLFYPAWQQFSTASHQIVWDSVRLEELDLPTVGDAAIAQRRRLQQRLNCTPFGQGLLAAAQQAKLTLQRQSTFTLPLGDQSIVISRQDLGSRVILPYVQRLNREVNTLLSEMEWTVGDVKQVLCTGGTASLGAIARWLRQKLPNATIIQDTYPTVVDGTESTPIPCSRVAFGLAATSMNPPLMQTSRAVKDDYSLLHELLTLWPGQPLSIDDIMAQLEQRGIDRTLHQARVMALLEGQLPLGLVPGDGDRTQFTSDSVQNPDYEKLVSTPLFYKMAGQTYLPKPAQLNHLRRYLDALTTSFDQGVATRSTNV